MQFNGNVREMFGMSHKGRLRVLEIIMNKTEKVIVPFCSLMVCLSCMLCTVLVIPSQKEYLTTCKNKHDDKVNQIWNIFAVNKVYADDLKGDMIKVYEIISGIGKCNNVEIRE